VLPFTPYGPRTHLGSSRRDSTCSQSQAPWPLQGFLTLDVYSHMLKGVDTAAADAIDACQWQIGVRAFRLQSGCSFAFVLPPKGPRSSYFPMRRGAGVVERDGLENRCTRKRTVGSNPTLSANKCSVSNSLRKNDPCTSLGISHQQVRSANQLQT
jgi:hypothetical protein